jgi:hypothetical protein
MFFGVFMILNLFSKTKILDSLLKEYNKQYKIFIEAYNELDKNKNILDIEAGVKMLGDTKAYYEEFMVSKTKEFRDTYGKAFEVAFIDIFSKHPKHVTLWLKAPNNNIPKFVSSDFVRQFRELLVNTDKDKFLLPSVRTDEKTFILKFRDFIKVKSKYESQKLNLSLLAGNKSSLLHKANEKTLDILNRQAEYINFNIMAFNSVIQSNLFDLEYGLNVDINNHEFDQDFTEETLRFINMLLHIFENEKVGINQPHLRLLQLEDLNKHNLDVSIWEERLEDFNLLLIA